MEEDTDPEEGLQAVYNPDYTSEDDKVAEAAEDDDESESTPDEITYYK